MSKIDMSNSALLNFPFSCSGPKLAGDMRGGAIAIGNFDGLHRGHQAVLRKTLDAAHALNKPALLLTFEPHPQQFFAPHVPLFRLTDPQLKAELASKLGFDGICVAKFDSDLASLSPDQFINQILADQLGAAHVVTGHDFHFGAKRAGTPELLAEAGPKAGFEVSLVDAFGDEAGEIISSSAIRSRLQEGEITKANDLLGYAWRFVAPVVKGQQLGRTLGFPTANTHIPSGDGLAHGIYAVRVKLADGNLHNGVASYGRRPTFDNGEPIFESFLLDYSGDLYGQEVTIYLHEFLRQEMKFDDADGLVEQMKRDEARAREILEPMDQEQGLWPAPLL